jgi:hypothetical protein
MEHLAVNSILTGDETSLYFYDVPTKAQNNVWVFEDENTPVSVQKSRSVKKRIVARFLYRQGNCGAHACWKHRRQSS